MAKITYEKTISAEELKKILRNVTFRGIFKRNGEKAKPYEKVSFKLATVYPPEDPTHFPTIQYREEKGILFTAQPTIYKEITDIMRELDAFLKTLGKRINKLEFEAIQYYWEGRGRYHVLPPIVEKHTYWLKEGKIDLEKILEKFRGFYIKDAKGNFHELSERFLQDFYIDNYTKIEYLDIFNSNVELISYGLQFNGPFNFFIICDGSHRIDYALQILGEPINVILVEGEELLPYYALPMPFLPLTRLTSKVAEIKYKNIERDKVHLLNDLFKKFLHYDWERAGLLVSKLRRRDLLDFLW